MQLDIGSEPTLRFGPVTTKFQIANYYYAFQNIKF